MLLFTLALLTFADLTGPTGPHSRQDEITTVATVNAVALVASARCPDILVDLEINQLEGALKLADADKKETFALTMVFSKEFGRQIERRGAQAWCDDVYARFGPEGLWSRGCCSDEASLCRNEAAGLHRRSDGLPSPERVADDEIGAPATIGGVHRAKGVAPLQRTRVMRPARPRRPPLR